MFKVTKENFICQCGHEANHHGSSGTCYKSTRRKERRKNPETGKYENYICCYNCSCRELKKMEKK